jgi:uncharacterized protein with predicted RNA binding PUA domain
LNRLPLDPHYKISRHLDALFGPGVSKALPQALEVGFSRRTGRIKNFGIDGKLVATLRTDGGLALTIFGAQYLLDRSEVFIENCVVPADDALPFVSEGRSLFCRHVKSCGSNIRPGSDVAVLDGDRKVIAVGVSQLSGEIMKQLDRGVAVKVREGLRSRQAHSDKN